MKNNSRIICSLLVVLCWLLLPALSLSAMDWGLQLDQTLGFEGITDGDNSFSYSGTIIPWLSTPLGQAGNVNLYLSAGATLEYADKTAFFIPELLRTELAWRMEGGKELKFGRIPYTDPLGLIASGLFDGARFSLNTGSGAFGAGVWYTGLLYKRSADITITDDDDTLYKTDLDYANFADTYFAPRRLLFALDWANPYLTDWLRLKAAVIGQLDLRGDDPRYHSQYLALKASVPAGNFIFDLGGAFELAEVSNDVFGETSYETKIALAGEIGIAWMLPTQIKDQLKFTGRFTNGTVADSSFAAFVPVTTIPQGDILQEKLSGLSMLRLDYTAQLNETFSFNAASSYFIASDLGTYKGFPSGRDGHFLGNEFSGRMIWSPFSDLQLRLGGGVFLPSMGNSGSSNGALWRVELNALLAIF